MNLFNQQYTGRMDWGSRGAQANQSSQNAQVSRGAQTEGNMIGWPVEEKTDTDCGMPPTMILPMDNMLQQMRTQMPQPMCTDMPRPMRTDMPQPMRTDMPQPMRTDMPHPMRTDMSQPMRTDMSQQMRTNMPQMNFGKMMENGMFPLGMSYVPMQEWSQPSPLEEGFNRGTMFSVLDLPFMMGRCR